MRLTDTTKNIQKHAQKSANNTNLGILLTILRHLCGILKALLTASSLPSCGVTHPQSTLQRAVHEAPAALLFPPG